MLLAFGLLLASFACGTGTICSFFIHFFSGSKIPERLLSITIILFLASIVVAIKSLVGS